eukprot:g28593.t1
MFDPPRALLAQARFSTRVRIPDFLSSELVQFMEMSALKLPAGAVFFEEQLAPRLAEHLDKAYGKDPGRADLKLQSFEFRTNTLQVGAMGCESEPVSDDAIDEELGTLIGMTKAKVWFNKVRRKVLQLLEATGDDQLPRACLTLGAGSAGSAKWFHGKSWESRAKVIWKVIGNELEAEALGTACQEATGGCLFLDLRHLALEDAQELMRILLAEVEDRSDLMVVLAGGKDEMNRLMRSVEGLSTCFPNRLHLDDYTPAELAQICEMYARPSTLAHARTRVTEEPELRLNALELG